MKSRFPVSSTGSRSEQSPARGLPIRVAAGAAGIVLAVVLGTGPLAAASAGVGSAAAKVSSVSSTPAPAGIHPIGYSLQKLGRFSGGLAAVRQRGLWGYVDRNGKAVVPFLYENASPFDSGYAVVRRDGRWEIIDTKGVATPLPRPLSEIAPFSEGLAAARERAGGLWGFIDRTGAFVIPPRYDTADHFANGLAAVAVRGAWRYITPTGSLALGTPYYRAYGFSGDGLALFREKRDGGYGYLRRDGTVAIAPVFPEAREFSGGLAPVRIGDRWGYISKTGELAIAPLYDEAFPFSGRFALVRNGPSRLGFIDASGLRAHENDFALAESYSEGIAVVGDAARLWYVDEAGQQVPAGEVDLAMVGDDQTSSCDATAVESVNGYNSSSVIFFRIVNQTNLRWTVDLVDTLANSMKYPLDYSGLAAVPGYPVAVEPASGPGGGIHTFLHRWIANTTLPSGSYPQFDMNLTSGDWKATLSSWNNYTAPPPPTSHPWWEWVKDDAEAMHGLFEVITGTTEGNLWEAAKGAYGIFKTGQDIASGVVDNAPSSNDNQKTDNVFVTSLAVTSGGSRLQPLNGGYCGGDSYTVSDGSQFVFALTTAKSALMPPTFQLTITPYAAFFAQQAFGKLDSFRQGSTSGGAYVTSDYYSCVYPLAFQDWSDSSNEKPCSAPTAFPKYDYMKVASALSPNDALDWWSFANNLPTTGKDPQQVGKWAHLFAGNCGTLPATCPSVLPMTASPPSFDVKTLETTCDCELTVSDAFSPVSPVNLPDKWSVNPGRCTDQPPPSPCTYTVFVPAGANGTFSISDTLTSIPIPVKCTSATMVVAPLSYSGTASLGSACPFAVNVQTPRGPVTSTPSTFVTSSTCTAQAESCSIVLSVPSPTSRQSISLSDAQTTQPINVECLPPPFTISQPSTYVWNNPGTPYCVGPVWASNTRGTVTTADPSLKSSILSSTCVGPQVSCSLTVRIDDTGSPVTFDLYDGTLNATTPVKYGCWYCSDSSGITIMDGLSHKTSAALGYKNTVYMNCYQLPITATQVPAGGSVDFSGCTDNTPNYCPVVTFAPNGGNFVFRDARGTEAPMGVDVVN